MKTNLKRHARMGLLLLALCLALVGYYYYVVNVVRVEVVQFNSPVLGKGMPYSVVLPRGYGLITSRRTRYPVLYLLHGHREHYNSWLKHPEIFTLAASMSGALDANTRNDDASIKEIFGEPNSPTRDANDLQRLAREFPRERAPLLPYFYLDCGTDDPWLVANRDFVNILLERKMVHEYRPLPGGPIWGYWDT